MGGMFQSLYTASDAIRLNQVAISVINNNIANMNTEGYNKQRVDLKQGSLMPGSIDELQKTSMGGVTLDTITRYSDSFMENYLRQEKSNLGYYDQMSESLSFVEDYFNELNGSGISGAMTAFYSAAQDLASDPTNQITRANFVQRAEDVAREFNSTYSNIENYRSSLVGDGTTSSLRSSQVYNVVEEINTKLEKIADLNSQITALTSSENVKPNALFDKRDVLLNELSEYIPIQVYAEGQSAEVYLGGIQLISGYDQIAKFEFDTVNATADTPAIVKVIDSQGGGYVYAEDFKTDFPDANCKLKGLLDIGGNGKNSIYDYMQNLDLLAREFAKTVNDVQLRQDATVGSEMTSACIDPATNTLKAATENIFLDVDPPAAFNLANISASNIRVNQNVIDDPFEVATAYVASNAAFVPDEPNGIGDNDNAVAFADSRNTGVAAMNNFNVEDKMASLISSIGSYTSSMNDSLDAQKAAVDHIHEKKQQAVGVNMDEELMDLVKYQNSYNASARVFSVVNEMLQIMMNLL